MSENLLQLQNGSKSYGSKRLFDQATFAVNLDEHIGVIGANGTGKTTLFRILLGEESLDQGQLIKSRQLRVGYLSQHDHWEPGETGQQFLTRTASIPLWEAKARGKALRVSEELLSRPLLSLSGGQRMRVKLLALLGRNPNLMLLDEPTNYLDLETTLVLENFLQSFDGAFLLISHDREFLKRTTDHILEIENGDITKFNGHIDDYFEQKEILREQLLAAAAHQAEKRKHILDFVSRFGASASKARQAQSRLKTLAKMEPIEIKPLPVGAKIKIPPPARTGRLVLELEAAELGYAERSVLTNVGFRLERGDHLAVVGLNGAGKSTLLKSLAGVLPLRSGQLRFGPEVKIAYFAQHVVEALPSGGTVLSSLSEAAHPEIKQQEILDLAGSLLFSGDEARKPIQVLSGGEKMRVALGRALLQRSPCLILDEPTNHLDFQTVEALTHALHDYEGTLIVVSHDRGFVQRVGTKILEVQSGKVRLYPGTYEDYVWSLQQGLRDSEDADRGVELKDKVPTTKAQDSTSEKKASAALSREEKKHQERERRAAEKRFQDCEKKLAETQARIDELNRQIAENPADSRGPIMELSKVGRELVELEALWLELAEKLQ